jgi:serine/threonine-protein kinase
MTAIEEHARSLFLAALGQAPDQWPAFLEGACVDHAELRARVEQLLQAHQALGSIHGGAAAAGPAAITDEPPREGPGTMLGPYKLLEQIGEGGFGVVFLAEQHQPVRRKVALKVLKPGMDSRQVVARFEAERQALALMDHPHIAHILDGGVTASGRPYFVMELVKGIPLTDYCDHNRLTVRQRLELFVHVCQAVQHAHLKGIIHRDLKPSNVLVTLHDDTPVPKVIDFGIAKALGQQLTDKTLFTGVAQLLGTPLYMSPEQARVSELDIDTRSDIYSLGVLLYQLLTGTTPIDEARLRAEGYHEIWRIIAEEEPPKPSTRLSTLGQAATTVSTNRQSDPKRLSQLVRGELDWIVMKALEKDRDRRYQSANSLALDLQRYLHDDPVQACPPSAGYLFRKYARRHMKALAVAGLILFFLVLLGGGVGWVVRDAAARRAETEQAVNRALRDAALLRDQGNLPEAKAAVRRAEELLAEGVNDAELGRRVRELRADLQMMAQLEEIRLQPPHAAGYVGATINISKANSAYAAAFRDYGIDVIALDATVAAERIRASVIRAQLIAALDDWLWVSRNTRTSLIRLWTNPTLSVQGARIVGLMGSPAGQGPFLTASATIAEIAMVAEVKPAPETTQDEHLRTVANLADPDEWRVRFRDPAASRDRQALERLVASMEAAAPPLTTMIQLARSLDYARAPEKAVEVLYAAQQRYPADFWVNYELALLLTWRVKPARLEEALGFLRAALAVHPEHVPLYSLLGDLLRQTNHLDQAIAAYRQLLDLQPDVYHTAYLYLGEALEKKRSWHEAITVYQQYIHLHPNVSETHYRLGRTYRLMRQWDRAIAAFQQAIRLSPRNVYPHSDLGLTFSEKGAWSEAVAAYSKALEVAMDNATTWKRRGDAYVQLDQCEQAVADFSRAIELSPKFWQARHGRGVAHGKLHAWDKAVTDYLTVLEQAPPRERADTANNLAWIFATCTVPSFRDPDRAVALATQAVKLANTKGSYWSTLGVAHYRTGQWKEAITALEQSMRLLDGNHHYAMLFLAMANWQLGEKERARSWYDRAVQWLKEHKQDVEKNGEWEEQLCRFRQEAEELLGLKND